MSNTFTTIPKSLFIYIAYCLLCVTSLNANSQSDNQPRLAVQTGHSAPIFRIEFSPNSLLLASASLDNSIAIWDIDSGRHIRSIHSPNGIRDHKFSTSGAILAIATGNAIRLHHVASGNPIAILARNSPTPTATKNNHISYDRIIFSNNDDYIAAATQDSIDIWHIPSRTFLKPIAIPSDTGRRIASIFFSDDSKTISAHIRGAPTDVLTLTWRIADATEVSTLALTKHDNQFFNIIQNNKHIIFASQDGKLRIWDRPSRQQTAEIDLIPKYKSSYAPILATTRETDKVLVADDNEIYIIDPLSKTPTHRQDISTPTISISHDGRLIAYVDKKEASSIRILSASDGTIIKTLSGGISPATSLALSNNHSMMIIGRASGDIDLLKYTTSERARKLKGSKSATSALAISHSNVELASSHRDRQIRTWDLPSQKTTRTINAWHEPDITTINWSHDDKRIISVGSGARASLIAWDIETKAPSFIDSNPSILYNAISPVGPLAARGGFNLLYLSDINAKRIQQISMPEHAFPRGLSFSPDGGTLAALLSYGPKGIPRHSVHLWNSATGQLLFRLPTNSIRTATAAYVTFSPDARHLIIADTDYQTDFSFSSWQSPYRLQIWDLTTQSLRFEGDPQSTPYTGIGFLPGNTHFVSSNANGSLVVSEIETGKNLASIFVFADGNWVVTTPEGYFDASNLEEIPYLHWVLPDEPFRPLPLEVFMRDYYEPRLLNRILSGEILKSPRPIAELNRVQPSVTITNVEPDLNDTNYVIATVEVAGNQVAYEKSKLPRSTDAYDLRLFRNGQLVAYADGNIAVAGHQPTMKTFRIKLPNGQETVRFSAYAFNNERIKSATSYFNYIPIRNRSKLAPRAFIVAVGINNHENPAWNLRYGAHDARVLGDSLADRLSRQKAFDAVVTIQLIADDTQSLATKANIRSVIEALAGRPTDTTALPGNDMLRKAMPDDLVIISFSGHGFEHRDSFHLLPSNTGPGYDQSISSEVLSRSISSDELTMWLRDVDAGSLVLIIDACHSAASVGANFKAGPMGNRGLGQMAFDKGMRLIAASQADEVALESDRVGHGLLSFALVREGLVGRHADIAPTDRQITVEEWLTYAVTRVPSLASEAITGQPITSLNTENSRGRVTRVTGTSSSTHRYQQPALFDFTNGQRNFVLDKF